MAHQIATIPQAVRAKAVFEKWESQHCEARKKSSPIGARFGRDLSFSVEKHPVAITGCDEYFYIRPADFAGL